MTTDPTAQQTADPTNQPPASPTPPPPSAHADTDTAGWTPLPGARPVPRRLVRPADDRVVAGVCAGLARHLGVDPVLVRVLAVVLTVMGAGSVAIAYLVAWVVVPKEVPPPAYSPVAASAPETAGADLAVTAPR